jgi:acyl carrier protein
VEAATKDVLAVLDQVLNLKGRTRTFELGTSLLGAVPELDSMAVVAVLQALEERFGFTIDDDEIDGSVFASVGSLVAFVDRKNRAA